MKMVLYYFMTVYQIMFMNKLYQNANIFGMEMLWQSIVECRTKEDIDTYTCYADHGIGIIFKKKI